MFPEIVGRDGPLAGQRFPIGDARMTLGRQSDCSVVIAGTSVSRFHAEVLREPRGCVLYDRGSRNGTLVNGVRITEHILVPGDLITIGDVTFCFDVTEATELISDFTTLQQFSAPTAAVVQGPVLNVAVSGGGPVGLAFALLLERLLGPRVAITIYDGRWTQDGARIVWKDEKQGNVRRQQVVTIQSRQFLNLPEEAQARLFVPGAYSEMWPAGPDSIRGYRPRNIRIAYIEDTLLALANEKSGRIRLVPAWFNPGEQPEALNATHVLAICEGARSRTREFFVNRFGQADDSIYSLDGRHLQDVVLGMRVKSDLPDPMSVLLTVAQNRYLLNSLGGEGFLNMRLTDAEAQEVIGLDPVEREFRECIASSPCLMERGADGDFQCTTHHTLFLPALIGRSQLWRRMLEGLKLYGVAERNLTAVTAFRLDMVQRPRFTARLHPPTTSTPGTYGFLLGDAANSIHFWPGRGLNSGLASAISLARSLANAWDGRPFRDADFSRHEAAMSMLQYRHKSRGWSAMIAIDDQGGSTAIKDIIAQSQEESTGTAAPDRDADVEALVARMRGIRERLSSRLTGLPDDPILRDQLRSLTGETLRGLVASGAWDTSVMGGEEVDIDIFYRPENPVMSANPVS